MIRILLLIVIAIAVSPVLYGAENLLRELPFRAAASSNGVDGWELQTNRKSPVSVSAAEGNAVRIAPRDGEMSVSLYAPAMNCPPGVMLFASVRAKGGGTLRMFATAADWKKDDAWNATHCAGSALKLNEEWQTFHFAFPAPSAERRMRFRIDAQGTLPVELADPVLSVVPASGGNLLSALQFSEVAFGGWNPVFNRNTKAKLSAVAEGNALRLVSDGTPMSVSLYAPAMQFPAGTVLNASVTARGNGTLRFFMTAEDWKKDEVWKATHQSGKEFKLGGEWQTFRFTCPAPAAGHPAQLRLDVTGAGPVELSAPELTVQTMEAAAERSTGNGENARPELVFESEAGKELRVDPETRFRFPLPATRDLSRGTLAFRFRLDDDLRFERIYRGIWDFEGTGLNSRFAFARINFGPKYFGLSQRIFGGEWHHAAYTWNADTGFRIYLDGRIAFLDGSPLARESAKVLGFGKTGSDPGFAGEIADVRLYDRELSDAGVGELYRRVRSVTPYPIDYAAVAGGERKFRIGFDNHSPDAARKTYHVTVAAADGRLLCEDTLAVEAPPFTHARREIAFTPDQAGDCKLTLTDSGTGDRFSFLLAILDSARIGDAMKPGPVKRKLLGEIDCTAIPAVARYRDDGKCRVVESPAGRYRETSGRELNSGFAYRFAVRNPGRPHWVEFEYPDDKARTFYCALGAIRNEKIASPFLDACGVITGGNFPLSDTMKTKNLFFVPDAEEYAVVFGSHRNPDGEAGPAVANIRIFELEGELPKLDLSPEGRRIMIWNEDPTMTAYTWFKQYLWTEETTNFDFWRDKLRRMVEYTRYIGWSEWNMLGYDYLGDNTSGDRRLVSSSYGASGGFLPGHLDMLAVTAEREEIPFYLSLNHLSGWNGAPAGLALEVGSDKLSRGYFDAIARGEEAPELFSAENKLAEIRGPALNPIHPAVRTALKRMFRAYADKFNRYAMFRGLDYQATEPLHFSSPEFGYEDYTVNRFRRETGAKLPDFRGVRRFGERRDWLKKHDWERWINWRCEAVAELVKELAGELDGRELILRVSLGRLRELEPFLERGELPDLKALYRDQGLDLDLLAAIPNVNVMPDLRPNYSRVAGRKADERALEFSDSLAALWSSPAIGSAQLTMHSNLEIHNSIARMPIRDLWGNSMFVSFSTPLPPGRFALEHFAWLVANADPQRINYGWWGNPEAGEEEAFREFYRAFSRIPRRSSRKLSGGNDPVAARQSGETVWLVNQCAYPATVSLSGATPFRLTDSVTGETVTPERIELPPFALRVFRQDVPVPLSAVAQAPPEALRADVEGKLARITAPNAASLRAAALFREGRFAAASYALQHRSLAGQLKEEPFRFKLAFDPDRPALTAAVENRRQAELAGELLFAGAEPVPFRLAPGKSRTFELLRLKTPPAEGKLLQFEAGLRADGRTTTRSLRYLPVRAARGAAAIPDGTWKNWGDAHFFPLDSRDPSRLVSGGGTAGDHFKAAFAVRWSPEGLSLAIRVEDRDFLPPREAGKMWENDSVVVYFDQKNNARDGVPAYDDDDVPFRIGLVDGKPVVRRGEPQQEDPETKCRIFRRGGETFYELFFPASVLPSARFEPGGSCGFSLEIINRFADGKRTVLSLCPEAPHRTPFVWGDLLFEEK